MIHPMKMNKNKSIKVEKIKQASHNFLLLIEQILLLLLLLLLVVQFLNRSIDLTFDQRQ